MSRKPRTYSHTLLIGLVLKSNQVCAPKKVNYRNEHMFGSCVESKPLRTILTRGYIHPSLHSQLGHVRVLFTPWCCNFSGGINWTRVFYSASYDSSQSKSANDSLVKGGKRDFQTVILTIAIGNCLTANYILYNLLSICSLDIRIQ